MEQGIIAYIGDTIQLQDPGAVGANPLSKLWDKFTEDRSVTKFNAAVKQQQHFTQKQSDAVYSQANRIHDALASRIGEPAASFGLYQSYHETGGWPKSYDLYWQYNNGSGIKYAGQKNAVKIRNGYAGFKTFGDWINSFVHELTKGQQPPASATTIEEFARRLKANGYYGDTVANYTRGLNEGKMVLTDIPKMAREGKKPVITFDANNPAGPGVDPALTGDDHSWDWWKNLKTWQKGGLIAAGGLIIITAVKR